MSVDLEPVLSDLLDQAISEHAFPGAVLAVGSSRGLAETMAAGNHTYAGERPTRADDLFDLASLTKVVCTTSVAMRLHGRGLLDLAAPVGELLPDFLSSAEAAPERREVTVAHLLGHCAGFPSWLPFHSQPLGTAAERRQRVLDTPLASAPTETMVYSDIGLITLGFLLAEQTGVPLAELVQLEVCAPLGMGETQYTPSAALAARCVPTECDATGVPLQGIVHDENARWLDGVAGHAGLFAPVADLARLGSCLLGGGEPVFCPTTLARFTKPAGFVPGSARCLGWGGIEGMCSGGQYLGPNSYGHTGFTGTSFWVDPDHDLYIILLTNAVHPKREDKANGFFPWRRRLHEAVYATLGLAHRI